MACGAFDGLAIRIQGVVGPELEAAEPDRELVLNPHLPRTDDHPCVDAGLFDVGRESSATIFVLPDFVYGSQVSGIGEIDTVANAMATVVDTSPDQGTGMGYFAAITPTESWEVAFRAAGGWRPTVLQHLLLGMNAHVDLDLGVASAEVAPGAAVVRPGMVASTGLLAVRVTEKRNPTTIIDILSGVGS